MVQGDKRVVEKVSVAHAGGEDDFLVAVDGFGGDPGNVGTLAGFQGKQRGRYRGFAQPLILGGELFEDGVEGEGVVVAHRNADGAECGAVGGEKRLHGCEISK